MSNPLSFLQLSKLNKELVEEEQPEMPKANISFDLKSEALETQNKKLKQDIFIYIDKKKK